MRRFLSFLVIVGIIGAGVAWFVTAPDGLEESDIAGITGDAARGEQTFWAAGCVSCHMMPDTQGTEDELLAGGMRFPSAFGTFIAPNISPSAEGIGDWSLLEFASAVQRGVGRGGEHLYPAFPWNAYNKASLQDIADIKAYIDTLPPNATPSQPHEVGFPFNIRRSLGGWKFLFENRDWVITGDLTEAETRGRYLSEAMAHCAECHTPRNALGGLDTSRWLGGAPNPDGKGRTPNITPAGLDWSEEEIVEYLTSGFTPDYDSAGGHMAYVVSNMAKLPEEDRAAIAAYLKKVPPVE
ncbi:MAG: c-type cytochrome [Pseudorhodobacter sp.]